ncbi:helix-turn-helix domain-containing protein [Mycobacterium spongiae]|uniref:Helix-turn-helix domain-containing protein n=1 Tax=Mycobacterium spongiae TaxID=886343 RepID=A0A975JXW8_9MYCO|nr:AraC family transcriptional regulator [Mycobacterium spongiae]QUR67719.1 helix-turn-helix domain-containing protein [Mycobacterium spongiae]
MQTYSVDPGWRVVLRDLRVEVAAVLRRAGLPPDLFGRGDARLTAEQFYTLWAALEQEYQDDTARDVALAVARTVTAEAFAPPIFAGLCSPTLTVAAHRIATYKRLLYPVTLAVAGAPELRIAIGSRAPFEPPPVLVRFELLFWVAFARLGTREDVRPMRLVLPEAPPDPDGLAAFIGDGRWVVGPRPEIEFTALDARRPFVTANDAMWQVFEPELRRRLTALDVDASWADRVHAALLTALPAGRRSLGDVADDLHVSRRSLQRWLAAEGYSFSDVLDRTRERLARHYLTSTGLSDTEIAFLIGYEELTSFHRAFRSWTGHTPGVVRSGHAAIGDQPEDEVLPA